MNRLVAILVCTFLSITTVFLYAKDYNKKSLQEDNQKLKTEINQLSKALSENENQSKMSVAYLVNLKKKLELRQRLINDTEKEITFINDEVYERQKQINNLEQDLSDLRASYASVLVSSYKKRTVQNKFLFLLSSNNFSEATRRTKYLKKYAEYQDKKIQAIKDKQAEISHVKSLKEESLAEQKKVVVSQNVEKDKLQVEEKQKEEIVAKYESNIGVLKTQIDAKQAQSRALDKQISAIIAEEVRVAQQKAAEQARKQEEARRKAAEAEKKRQEALAKAEAERQAALKAEQERVAAERAAVEKAAAEKAAAERIAAAQKAQKEAQKSEDKRKAQREEAVAKADQVKAEQARKEAQLAAQKKSEAAKLAQQKEQEAKRNAQQKEQEAKEIQYNAGGTVSSSAFEARRGSLPMPVSGTVVAKFGKNPHPILSGVIIESSGIQIAARRGAQAKAVYDGEVSAIIAVPGGGRSVMVKHGGYFTVYSNLQSISVSKGSRISAGQPVGTIYTDSDGNTLLEFQVWKGTSPQNPSSWVR